MVHARAFGAALPADLTADDLVLDLGSGGGLPGLVVAVERPETSWVLLDAGERRTAFLERVVDSLGLGARVKVARGRAEEVGRRPENHHRFAAVCARSFGPPAVTAECAAPFLREGGVLVVSEPPESSGDRWPATPLATLGLELMAKHDDGPRLAVLRQVTVCADRFPRRAPGKRPLW